MKRYILTALILSAAPVIGSTGVLAEEPVAIVEEVSGRPPVEAMDYLRAGQVIRLGAGDRVIIDYLQSCAREIIAGGVITIGKEESLTAGSHIEREKIQCDGGRFILPTDQATQSAVVVFRAPPRTGSSEPAITVDRVIYGLSPLIDLKGGGILVIERLDRPSAPVVLDIPTGQLIHGTIYDLAKEGRALAAGGIYKATAAGRSIVFKIDPFARAGEAPPVARLLRF